MTLQILTLLTVAIIVYPKSLTSVGSVLGKLIAFIFKVLGKFLEGFLK